MVEVRSIEREVRIGIVFFLVIVRERERAFGLMLGERKVVKCWFEELESVLVV